MHLRISIILCCTILLRLAVANQNAYGLTGDAIDIDVEGSGGDFKNYSGSGDRQDTDDEDFEGPVDPPPKVITSTTTTQAPIINRKIPDLGENPDVIMNPKQEEPPASFFAQPGILAAVIGGAVVGLLCAILVVMFIVYRMRKKDEGSYALDEPKRSPTSTSFNRGNKEFYA
ncbi:syndecan isoform X1 [Onthophagus taurus]|uniref:syndecan isoform X1 n=2 Tax=Onthophagus taurus TaxID=166361 RepID=UPI000C205E69|nr:syndecan isoform X1 [Onthophagus taurus]